MTDAALATIGVEVERLRDDLRAGKVQRAAVIVLIEDRAYLSLKAENEDAARDYLGDALLKLFVHGGLATDAEIDAL